MAAVDLVDNLQVSRQQVSKQLHWPALQSFWKDGVVGVGTGPHTDVPGLSRTVTEQTNLIIFLLLCLSKLDSGRTKIVPPFKPKVLNE